MSGPELKLIPKYDGVEIPIKCWKELALLRQTNHEQQDTIDALREAIPDYKRVIRAKALMDTEYVGQAQAPLWAWAWEKAALDRGTTGE